MPVSSSGAVECGSVSSRHRMTQRCNRAGDRVAETQQPLKSTGLQHGSAFGVLEVYALGKRTSPHGTLVFVRLSRCEVPARLIEQPLHCPHRDPEKAANTNCGDFTTFRSRVRAIAREAQIAPTRLRHRERQRLVFITQTDLLGLGYLPRYHRRRHTMIWASRSSTVGGTI
jgi:hypothetical protein